MMTGNVVLVIENHTRDLKLPVGVEQDARQGKVELWNAPRPFAAHEHYTGEFMHGVHYGVIRPDADYADEFRRSAIRDDAHRVEFISADDVMAYGQSMADRYGIDVGEYDYADIVLSYIGMRRRQAA